MSIAQPETVYLVGPGSIGAAIAALYEGGASVLVVWSRSQERLSDAGRTLVDLLAQEGCSFEPYVPAGASALIDAANRLLKDVNVEGLSESMMTRQCMVLVVSNAQTMEGDELQAMKRLLVALAGSAVRVVLLACAPTDPFDSELPESRLSAVCHLALDEPTIAPRRETSGKLDFEIKPEPEHQPGRSSSGPDVTFDLGAPPSVFDRWKLKALIGAILAALLLLATTAVLDLRNPEFSRTLRNALRVETGTAKSISFDCGTYASEAELKTLRKSIDARLPVLERQVDGQWVLRVGPLTSAKAVDEARNLLWSVGACAINPSAEP